MIRLTIFAIFLMGFIFLVLRTKGERKPYREYHSIDVVVPIFNEANCAEYTLKDLLDNSYIKNIVCVNDGSTDNTGLILDNLQTQFPEKIIVVHQWNKGKAAAQNEGLKHVTSPYVFFTDADTRIPNDDGVGYLIAKLKDGAAAAGGVAGSDLSGARFLAKVKASIKVSNMTLRRGGMKTIGGSPFCITGSCGLFRVDVLESIGGIPERANVEDLDLTWTLMEKGYRVDQSLRCIVFSQQCNTFKEKLQRRKRWVAGYASCMRIHKTLLLSRFGFASILLVALVGVFGLTLFYLVPFILFYVAPDTSYFARGIYAPMSFDLGPFPWWILLSPWAVPVLLAKTIYSAKIQKKWSLVLYSPFAVIILLMTLFAWLRWGIPTLITGKEPARIKPRRY